MSLREAARRTLARRRRLVALGGLALTAMCALPAPAEAGSFRVSQCAAWDGAAWTGRSFQVPPPGTGRPADPRCDRARAGGLSVRDWLLADAPAALIRPGSPAPAGDP